MTVYHVANLDPDSALFFLGPADFNEFKPMRLMQHYTNLISNIAITIIRAINYIFRDHIWYNNSKARDLVIHYINTFERVDYSDEVHQKVSEIFEELKVRQWGWFSSVSYADGLAQMAAQKGIQLDVERLDDDDIQPLNFGRLQDRNLYVLSHGTFKRGKTGNLSMLTHKETLEETNRTLAGLGFEGAPVTESLQADEETFRKRTYDLKAHIRLHADAEAVNQFKNQLLEALGFQRAEFPEGFDREGKLLDGSQDDIKLADFVFNEEYAEIKDPHRLFEKAILTALLPISESVSDSEFSRYLKRLATNRSDPAWNCIIKAALVDLLTNACIDLDDCHHSVYLNSYNSACYQKPILTASLDGELTTRFKPDLLSTSSIGSDPEVAARMLKEIKAKGSTFDVSNPHKFPALHRLLDDMTIVFKQRHLPHVLNLLKDSVHYYEDNSDDKRDLGCYEKPIKEFLKDAKTAHEVFTRAIDYAAQKYASTALIAQDDIIGAIGDDVNLLICKSAIFEMLLNAEVVDDFTLKLNDHVSISFANFFAMVETKNDPLLLECKELPDYNVMCESEANADPIYLASLLSQVKSGARNVEFLREYLFAEEEVRLYKQKKDSLIESGDKEESDFEGDLDLVARPEKIKLAMSRLPRDSKEVAKEIGKNLAKVSRSFYRHFYSPNQMQQEVYEKVEFKEDALPSIASFDASSIWNVVEKVDKPIDRRYLQGLFFGHEDRVTIKSRSMPRAVHSSWKLTQTAANSMSPQGALEHQNNTIQNPARCGNCGYGALALEIWEGIVNDGNIERFNLGLRQVVARYLRENKEEMATKFLEGQEKLTSATRPILLQRVEKYARDVLDQSPSLLWISDIEIDIISKVLGVRIDVFDYSQQTSFRVAAQGPFEGTIMPNRVYGAQFSGAPIRLKFTGNHFLPIRLK